MPVYYEHKELFLRRFGLDTFHCSTIFSSWQILPLELMLFLTDNKLLFFLVMMFPVMKILEGYLITTPGKNIWWGVSYLLWNYFEVYIYM